MKERLVACYRAVRSVRTSTWVLLLVAIGSNFLYYQVRPDPIDDGSRRPGEPVVTRPDEEGIPDGTPTTVPPVDTTVPPSVPSTVVEPVETTGTTGTTAVAPSSVVPPTSGDSVPDPGSSDDDPQVPGGVPGAPPRGQTPPATG